LRQQFAAAAFILQKLWLRHACLAGFCHSLSRVLCTAHTHDAWHAVRWRQRVMKFKMGNFISLSRRVCAQILARRPLEILLRAAK